MTRTLVISDLHLGSRLGRDTLRRPAVLSVLVDALRDVDRLVLLGDTVELLEARGAKAMAAARPVLEALGTALGRDREIVFVPGNHDHALVRPWVRERQAAGRGIGLASRVPLRSSARLREVAGWLAPARVEVRYPGVWLGDRVWATHGHYLDRHVFLLGSGPEAGAGALAYEGAPGVALSALADLDLPPVVGETLDFAVQAAHWTAALTVPAAARLTRGTLAPLSAGALGFQFRFAGLPAFVTVTERLRVPADHVIFGHLHRGGAWSIGGRDFLNSGSWVYEPLLLAGAHPPHAYWPGGAVLVEDGVPPRTVGLLDDLDPRLLR